MKGLLEKLRMILLKLMQKILDPIRKAMETFQKNPLNPTGATALTPPVNLKVDKTRKAWIGQVGKDKTIYVTRSPATPEDRKKQAVMSIIEKYEKLSGTKPTSQDQLKKSASVQKSVAEYQPDAAGPCEHLPEPCAKRCRTDRKPDDSDECKKRGYTYLLEPPEGATWSAYIVKHCGGASRTVWSGMGTSHGHHIVMKKGRKAFSDTVLKSQQILCKNDIDPFCGKENLIIARNWCHSETYAKIVLAGLKEVQTSGRKAIGDKLRMLADLFEACDFDVAQRDTPMQMVDDRFDELR